jgi:hypothetical protein
VTPSQTRTTTRNRETWPPLLLISPSRHANYDSQPLLKEERPSKSTSGLSGTEHSLLKTNPLDSSIVQPPTDPVTIHRCERERECIHVHVEDTKTEPTRARDPGLQYPGDTHSRDGERVRKRVWLAVDKGQERGEGNIKCKHSNSTYYKPQEAQNPEPSQSQSHSTQNEPMPVHSIHPNTHEPTKVCAPLSNVRQRERFHEPAPHPPIPPRTSLCRFVLPIPTLTSLRLIPITPRRRTFAFANVFVCRHPHLHPCSRGVTAVTPRLPNPTPTNQRVPIDPCWRTFVSTNVFMCQHFSLDPSSRSAVSGTPRLPNANTNVFALLLETEKHERV